MPAIPPLQNTPAGWVLDDSVRGITIDSRRVAPGFVFVAIPGQDYDGHDFIADAIRRGAVAVVGERSLSNLSVPYVRVASSRVEAARIAAAFFHHPSWDLAVAGVTGTNGKTSVAFWLAHLLRAQGFRTGMLSSVVNELGEERVEAHLTTPESPDLQAYLARIRDSGFTHAVVEVSSHGIVQHRVDGVTFALAILTNITREHLDFHGTMENYVASKARLFSALPADSRGAVLNADDRYFDEVRSGVRAPVLTYGINGGEVRGEIVEMAPWSSELRIHSPAGIIAGQLRHPGRYNVYNLLAAVAAALRLGVAPAVIEEAVPTLPAVPGRMHVIRAAGAPTVIVDYAHTPDGLAQALLTTRRFGPQALWLVFGARGGRDQGKRPEMGQISARYADRIVVTTDSPYREDPKALADSLVGGIVAADPSRLVGVELDRCKAIWRAVGEADPADIILITGRGPETAQQFGDRRVRLVDAEVAKAAIEARQGGRLGKEGGVNSGPNQRSHPRL